ncbi:MAG: SAM-dependent methyltransferase [Anaerolineae bacterium]
MAKESIVDASVPSAGRIYDYFLGGHHNFQVDRIAAEQILQRLPFLGKLSRLQRWCLRDIAQELTAVRGYDVLIDFASGLPTQDHMHTVVPPGTTVIYSDYDPVVVQYAKEILGDTKNVYFFEADASRPEELLNSPKVEAILNGRRNVGIVYWGVGGFLSDEAIAHAAQALYDWSGPFSCWAFNAQGADGNPDDPIGKQVLAIYAQMGSPFRVRTLQEYEQVLKPWKGDEQGYLSFLEWHGFDQGLLDDRDREVFGATGTGYGMYLLK